MVMAMVTDRVPGTGNSSARFERLISPQRLDD
jgi:hypothetical protein